MGCQALGPLRRAGGWTDAARFPAVRSGNREGPWTGARPSARTCRRSSCATLRELTLDEPSGDGPARPPRGGQRRRPPRRLRVRDRRRRALPRRLPALGGRPARRAAARARRRPAARPRRAQGGQARPRGAHRAAALRRPSVRGAARARLGLRARAATAASCGRSTRTASCGATAREVDLAPLYGLLSESIEHLNVEGAAVMGDRLWLLQRGGSDDHAAGIVAELDLGDVMDVAAARPPARPRTSSRPCAPTTSGTLDGVPLTFSRRDAGRGGAARLHRLGRGGGRRASAAPSSARSARTATSSGCARSTAATRSRASTPRSTRASWTSSSSATRTIRRRRRRSSRRRCRSTAALEREDGSRD